MGEYLCETRNVNAFVRQIVRYVSSGHYYYVRCLMKDRAGQLAPEKIDSRLVQKYDIARKPWQRKKRHLKDRAGIHYLRFGRLYVFMLSKGKHDLFYRDHGTNVENIRYQALTVFSYKIKYSYSQKEKRNKVFVRLSDKEKSRLTQHMLTICSWDCYRDPRRLEREFANLPYDGYDPVHNELVTLARKVNRARKKRGFLPISLDCINRFVAIQKTYVDTVSDDFRQKAA